jgi:hypothetical protein
MYIFESIIKLCDSIIVLDEQHNSDDSKSHVYAGQTRRENDVGSKTCSAPIGEAIRYVNGCPVDRSTGGLWLQPMVTKGSFVAVDADSDCSASYSTCISASPPSGGGGCG